MSIDDSVALQIDDYCATAMRAVALLAGLTSSDPEVGHALDLLGAWDGHEGAGSAAAAIAEVWLNKHLGPQAVARVTPKAAVPLAGVGSPYAVIAYLQAPDGALGDDPMAARDRLLLASLRSALDRARRDRRTPPDLTTAGRLALGRAAPRHTSSPPRQVLADEGLAGADEPRPHADPGLGLYGARRHLPDGRFRRL